MPALGWGDPKTGCCLLKEINGACRGTGSLKTLSSDGDKSTDGARIKLVKLV